MCIESKKFLPGNRIKSNEEYSNAFAKYSRKKLKHIVFLYNKNDYNIARFGVVVSKKTCKLAVTRNRLKRICREEFRHSSQPLSGFDVVVVFKRSFSFVSLEKQQEVVKEHWGGLLQCLTNL